MILCSGENKLLVKAVPHLKETKGQESHLVVFASEAAGVVHGHVGRLAIVRFEAPQVEPLPAHLRKATGVLLVEGCVRD